MQDLFPAQFCKTGKQALRCSVIQEIECEAELVLATLMESQQAEPLSQQPQPGPAGGRFGAAPNSVVPGDTPYGARGRHRPGL